MNTHGEVLLAPNDTLQDFKIYDTEGKELTNKSWKEIGDYMI